MQIQEHLAGEIGVLQLSGRVTVNDRAGALKDAVSSLVRQGALNVILDLGGVQFIDSTRLGEIIAAHITVGRHGGRLLLAATPPRVLELLELSGLDDVFERFDSVEAATAALTGGRPAT